MRMFFKPRLLLPLMVVTGFMVLGFRVNDVWTAASEGRLFAPPALAETKSDAPAPAPDAKPADTKTADVKPPDVVAPTSPPDAAATDDTDLSPAEIQVLNQLSQRRGELDKRAKDLDTREAFVKIAEQRVDQKIKEMETLRQQLQTMVNQIGAAQNAELDNLVKIYETMKPDDAAKIFGALDMPVLLGVIQRMKPKSVAPILAKMTPEKAKQVTVALTKQDQLPQIK
jgi:flagellar motility protein MotE (MotC chaperone)